jgi:RNA polymerase sigma-70 factor (ECF subfamily)
LAPAHSIYRTWYQKRIFAKVNTIIEKSDWQKFAQGDSDTWRQFVQQQTVKLYAVFMKRWPNPTLAEELAQKSIFDAVKARSTYNPDKGSPEQWIYAIALNNLRLEIRKRAIRKEANSDLPELINNIDNAPLPDEAVEKQETYAMVNHALDQIGEKERGVLKARYIDDLKASAIAEKMDITTKAVHSLLYRAKIALKNKLIILAPEYVEGRRS